MQVSNRMDSLMFRCRYYSTAISCGLLLLSIFFSNLSAATETQAVIAKDDRHASVLAQQLRLFNSKHTVSAANKNTWPQSLKQLSEQLAPDAGEHHWQFTQSRYLRLLHKPIMTQGELIMSQNDGDTLLVWRVDKPVYSEFHIRNGQLLQIKNGRARPTKMGDQPAFAMLAKFLSQALHGQLDGLMDGFDVYWLTDEKQQIWSLGIRPRADGKRKQLQQFLRQLSFRGQFQTSDQSARIDSVVIVDMRDDLSLFELQSAALSSHETRE